MKGAILYATKYGSTAEYAKWISDATGLPLFDVNHVDVELDLYDFVILATPVIYYRLLIRDWIWENLFWLYGKKVIIVTVSGAPPGPKLDAWVGDSLPPKFISEAKHFGLRGRQIPSQLSWFDRAMLIIAAWKNPDPVASREELKGFDYMDKESIAPILALARDYMSRESSPTKASAASPIRQPSSTVT